jgi:hypothetical protein
MKKITLALLIAVLFALSSFAQTTVGRLVGTVSSPDGVLPGATVVLTDNKSGKETTTTTNSTGAFSFLQLEVGSYALKVDAKGFKSATRTGIEISVGQEYSLPVSLEIGAVTENVTITAGEDLVNSSNPEISKTIDSKKLTELPLAARNPLSLILTQSGTASNPSQGTSINGQRTSFTNIIRDGINIQDNFIRSNATDFAPGRPSVDDVDQFTLTTQSDASRGFGGPQVELVTPRGQNAFKGTLFTFNRNSKFGANSWFNNAGGNFGAGDAAVIAGQRKVGDERNPRPFRNRNQFGGNLSGPIIKKKLFFFGFYERLTDRIPATKLNTVLTPSARTGIFRYSDTAGAIQSVNLFALPGTAFSAGTPATPGPFPVNAGIGSRFIANIPNGNSVECGDGLNTTCFRFQQKADTNRHSFTTRIDYDINEKNSVNGVYNYVKEDNLRADIDGTFNTTPTAIQPSSNKFLALAWRTTIASNFVNEVRGGLFFSKPDFLRTVANPAAFYNLPLVTNPELAFQEQGRYVKTINLQDSADYIIGSHSLRFGGQFQQVKINAYNDANKVATYGLGTGTNAPAILTSAGNGFLNSALFPNFPTLANSAPQRAVANGLLALLGGIINGGTQQFNATTQTEGYVLNATQAREFKYQAYSGYFNDNWRAATGLTLNLGIRYDVYTGLEAVNGLALEPILPEGKSLKDAVLDPTGAYQFIGGNAGKRNRFYKTDKNNFAPVLGFAYSLPGRDGVLKSLFGGEGKTVIRGGFRFSYVNDELVRAPDNALLGNQGLSFTNTLFNPGAINSPASLNFRFGSEPRVPTPVYTPIENRTFASNNAAASLQGTVFAVDPNVQSPRTTEYSIGLTRELGWDSAIEVRYVGGRSKSLLRGVDFNQIDINSNGFLADFNRARSNLLLCNATTGCATGAAFNSAIVGSQVLTVFPNLANPLLTNATITNSLIAGTPADLATTYLVNGLAGSVRFTPNSNAFVADLLSNGAEYYYNSLQVDLTRRFSQGLTFQGNYTFSKTLTNAQGTGQTRFEPLLDNARPELEYSRADFDQPHVFNLNFLYELPVGKGKRLLNDNRFVDAVLGGWQLNGIVRVGIGAPITFTDARGTFNRAGRSGRQTALTSLSKKELKALVGTFRTPCGIYFINPTALNINQSNLNAGICSQLNVGATGRGANGFGSTPFSGQVFFNNAPGQTSGLERAVVNGPWTRQVDFTMLKNFKFGERMKLQVRGELFNAFNSIQFVPGQFIDISSTTFGRVTGATGARVAQFALRFSF